MPSRALAGTRRRLPGWRAAAGLLGGWCVLMPLAQAMTGLLLMDAPPQEGLRWSTGMSMWRLRGLPGDVPRERTWVFPALEVRSSQGWFLSTDVGAGWRVVSGPTELGVRLSPWPGRTAPGVQVGTRWEQSVYLNRSLGDVVLLQSSTRHGGGQDGRGWITEAGLTTGIPLPHGEAIGITVGSSWANGRYRTTYDGTGRPWPGGWQDVQLGLSYEHRLDARWRVQGQWLVAQVPGGTAARYGAESGRPRSISLGLWRDWGDVAR